MCSKTVFKLVLVNDFRLYWPGTAAVPVQMLTVPYSHREMLASSSVRSKSELLSIASCMSSVGSLVMSVLRVGRKK